MISSSVPTPMYMARPYPSVVSCYSRPLRSRSRPRAVPPLPGSSSPFLTRRSPVDDLAARRSGSAPSRRRSRPCSRARRVHVRAAVDVVLLAVARAERVVARAAVQRVPWMSLRPVHVARAPAPTGRRCRRRRTSRPARARRRSCRCPAPPRWTSLPQPPPIRSSPSSPQDGSLPTPPQIRSSPSAAEQPVRAPAAPDAVVARRRR